MISPTGERTDSTNCESRGVLSVEILFIPWIVFDQLPCRLCPSHFDFWISKERRPAHYWTMSEAVKAEAATAAEEQAVCSQRERRNRVSSYTKLPYDETEEQPMRAEFNSSDNDYNEPEDVNYQSPPTTQQIQGASLFCCACVCLVVSWVPFATHLPQSFGGVIFRDQLLLLLSSRLLPLSDETTWYAMGCRRSMKTSMMVLHSCFMGIVPAWRKEICLSTYVCLARSMVGNLCGLRFLRFLMWRWFLPLFSLILKWWSLKGSIPWILFKTF